MPVTKAQIRATNKYMSKNYDNLRIVVPKGQKAAIEAFAKQKGESINGLVNKLLRVEMGLSAEEWKDTQKDESFEIPYEVWDALWHTNAEAYTYLQHNPEYARTLKSYISDIASFDLSGNESLDLKNIKKRDKMLDKLADEILWHKAHDDSK